MGDQGSAADSRLRLWSSLEAFEDPVALIDGDTRASVGEDILVALWSRPSVG